MFVCHYVIIPFHPQYLPRHAPQGGGIQGGGIGVPKLSYFLYYCIITVAATLHTSVCYSHTSTHYHPNLSTKYKPLDYQAPEKMHRNKTKNSYYIDLGLLRSN